MSPLRSALADYLAVRRALGRKLKEAEVLLVQFIAYLEDLGEETISAERALAWAMLPAGHASASWLSQRLSTVRGFATYMQAINPATEVPAAGLLSGGTRRTTPYIYSEKQIAAVIEETGRLRPPHRAATYRTLIGLLVATGMRAGEVIGLDRRDIDLQAQAIVVRGAKFGKSRELALHRSTADALRRYLRREDRPSRPTASGEPAFVSLAGTRLFYSCVRLTFSRLLANTGVEPRSADCRPTLHGLRHTFAVRTILDGYREGGEVEGRLAALSTYLGHVNPSDTYWYLSGAPELMGLAAERLERHIGGGS